MDQDQVPAGLSSSITTLAGLFRGHERLVVPRYQRAYAWSNAEAGRLMEDLRDAFQADAPHFFVGTVVLIVENDRDRVIVDGQQRLATFTILLATLRARLAAGAGEALESLTCSAPGEPRVLLRPHDRAFFADLVAGGGADWRGAATEALPDPQQSLLEAAEVIGQALAELSPPDLARFTEYLLRRVTFNRIETRDRAGAPRLFLVLNETGGDLSAADLVKAELFERAGLSEAEAEEAAARWDDLINVMGRRGLDELLSFMPGIANSVSAKAADPDGVDADLGAVRRSFLDHVDPREFLKSGIFRYADALLAIRNAQVDAGMHSAEVNRRIRCLQLLSKDRIHWIAPAVAYVAETVDATERLLPFFEGLERLAYACFLAIVESQNRGKRFAAVLRARNDPTALFGPNGALELSTSERRRMIHRLNQPFRTDKQRRRIIALRFNAALPGGETLALTDDVNVEHILPINPDKSWERGFPDAVNREALAHIVGNFALLTPAQNRRCADRSFAEKRRIYFETRGAPLRALTRTLKETADWTATTLRRRHETLIEAMCEDWRLV